MQYTVLPRPGLNPYGTDPSSVALRTQNDSHSKCLKTCLKTHLSKRTRHILYPHGRAPKDPVSAMSLREAIALQPEETTPAPTCIEPSSLCTTQGVPIVIAASQHDDTCTELQDSSTPWYKLSSKPTREGILATRLLGSNPNRIHLI